MDIKVTLSFDEEVVLRAKKFAEQNNISLSRLTEYLFDRITHKAYSNLEELPISEWVNQLAEGAAIYKTKKSNRKALKAEFYKSRK